MKKRLVQGLFITCAGFSVNAFALGYTADFEVCMRKAQSQSNGINTCQIKEYKAQNKRVKKLYKLTLKTTAENEKALVKQSQDVWLQRRDHACNIQNRKVKAFSISNSSCAVQMTMSHADMMEVRLNNKNMK